MHALGYYIKKFSDYTFLRFLVVGFANTAFSYGIYAIFLFVGLDFKIANFLALAAGIVVSFKTQGKLVFNNTDNKLLFRFVVSWAAIYPISILLISVFMEWGFSSYAAGALCLPFNVAMSYLSQKFFVFRGKVKG
jgi:putative flippase GtrA